MEGKIIKCVPNEPIERSPDDIIGAEIYSDPEENDTEINNQEIQNQEGGIEIDAGDDEIEIEQPSELKAVKGKSKPSSKPTSKPSSKPTSKPTSKPIKKPNVQVKGNVTKKPPTSKKPSKPSFIPNQFQKDSLNEHNLLRKKHHVGDLILNKELCDIAQKYADKLAATDTFQHSKSNFKGKPMGENLFACCGMDITGKLMTDSWYDEIKDYNFNNPGFKGSTGHFTQVVWNGSKQVGFGFAKSNTGYYYGVANYFPAGNYINEFEKNVLKA